MNTVGVILGAAIGWWTVRLAARIGTRPTDREATSFARRAATWTWTSAATAAAAAWFAVGALNPIPSDPCEEQPAGAKTTLAGGIAIYAGSRSGHLCIDGPDGDRAGLGSDPTPGILQTYGAGDHSWSIGLAPAGTRTAHDKRGTTAHTYPVHGSTLRAWSTYRDTRAQLRDAADRLSSP